MKTATLVPAILIAAISLFSAAGSLASCQNHCVHAYKHCLRSDSDLAACQEQLADCLAQCGSRVPNGSALENEEQQYAKPVRNALSPLKQPDRAES